MKLNRLSLMCAIVLCTILTLGLWPFHSPANEVAWSENHNALRFGRHGTVISSAPFQITHSQNSPEASLEIWLQPNRIWDSGTVLVFYRPGNPFQFSLRQSQTDVLIRTWPRDERNYARTANLYVNEVFRGKSKSVFMTITAGAQGTSIYINGILATAAPQFPLSATDFTGRLVLGDSPGQTDTWSGQLLGLAIYHRQLTAAQVFHNYATWKQTGRPEITGDERNVALYLFDEHAGDVVHDKARSSVDLNIPERYQVLDKIVLEPFWNEFAMSGSYWAAALKNIVGFTPFGFCFYAYLATLLPVKRAALVTVAMGTVVSFTIEILQAFLPTRESGTTDLITNTLGTWFGVLFYRFSTPVLARFLPWLPFETRPLK